MSTVPPTPQADALNRRAPSDLWLWLVVILPTISAALAFYKLECVGLLLTVFGLAALECGRFTDAKVMHVVARNLACGFVTAVLYIGLQFAMDSFAEPVKTADGEHMGDYSAITWTPIPFWIRVRIQSLYCATCGLLLTAGLTREVRPAVQLGLCTVLALFVYPIFTAWSWGGWLMNRGFHDFAGGTIVHSLAGWSTLAVLVVRRWMRDGRRDAPLYLTKRDRSWLSIGGAVLLAPGLFILIHLVTPVHEELFDAIYSSAACGVIAASVISLLLVRTWRLQFALVGGGAVFAALAAVPGPPIVGSFIECLCIGFAAGSLAAISMWCIEKLGIADHLGVVSACGVGGATGTIAVAFLNIASGTLFQPVNLKTQLLGAAVAFVWAIVVFGGITWAAIYLVQKRRQVMPTGTTATQSSGE